MKYTDQTPFWARLKASLNYYILGRHVDWCYMLQDALLFLKTYSGIHCRRRYMNQQPISDYSSSPFCTTPLHNHANRIIKQA